MGHHDPERTNRMSAATDYASRHDAAASQQSRIFGPELPGDPWGTLAGFFRLDPNRDPEPNLQIISSYLRPEDALVDVGGGAGRVCLPMAQYCREVVMVEPSTGMGAEFEASRTEAGVSNARRVQAEWMDAQGIEGDMVFSGCVTYFVRDVVPFVEKLVAAARRRVMITLWNEPPPCRGARCSSWRTMRSRSSCPAFASCYPCCGRWISCPTCWYCRTAHGGRRWSIPAARMPWSGLFRVHGFALRTGNGPPASSGTISRRCSSPDMTVFVPDGSGR